MVFFSSLIYPVSDCSNQDSFAANDYGAAAAAESVRN
jgi:hypothetical protein